MEADLVNRYGSKIRALPSEGTLNLLLAAAGVVILGVGLFGAMRLRAWRRSTDKERVKPSPSAPRIPDAYDARIDAELAELD